jgi:hypothetical protein
LAAGVQLIFEPGVVQMSASQRSYLTAMVIAACFNGAASAQTVDLVCNGAFHQYEPKEVHGTAGPGATRVDLGQQRISTPVGEFSINKVNETTIYFNDPGKSLVVFGYVDRLTGEMRVFWRRPEEEAKMQAGLPHKVAMYAELRCSPCAKDASTFRSDMAEANNR